MKIRCYEIPTVNVSSADFRPDFVDIGVRAALKCGKSIYGEKRVACPPQTEMLICGQNVRVNLWVESERENEIDRWIDKQWIYSVAIHIGQKCFDGVIMISHFILMMKCIYLSIRCTTLHKAKKKHTHTKITTNRLKSSLSVFGWLFIWKIVLSCCVHKGRITQTHTHSRIKDSNYSARRKEKFRGWKRAWKLMTTLKFWIESNPKNRYTYTHTFSHIHS